MVENTRSSVAADAFRKHRHDVMNGLQLVRAYIQLERPQDAIRSLDQLANWLKGLSLCQGKLQFGDDRLLWLMSQCNLVMVKDVVNVPSSLTKDVVDGLVSAWHWLQDLAVHRQKPIDVTVHGDQLNDGTWKLQVRLDRTEENSALWNTVEETEQCAFGNFVQVLLAGNEHGGDV